MRRDRPPSSLGTTGSTGPLPNGPDDAGGTDMTGHPSADKQENSPAPTTTTSDDTSPQPAYCRSRRGRGRPRAVIKDRAEATTTPVSYGMTPPRDGATTAHSSYSHPFRQPQKDQRQGPFYLIVSMLVTIVMDRSALPFAPRFPRPSTISRPCPPAGGTLRCWPGDRCPCSGGERAGSVPRSLLRDPRATALCPIMAPGWSWPRTVPGAGRGLVPGHR